MKIEPLISEIAKTKQFVRLRAADTSSENVEEIQSLLSETIECAKANDEECVRTLLDQIDAIAVPGWKLTTEARLALE